MADPLDTSGRTFRSLGGGYSIHDATGIIIKINEFGVAVPVSAAEYQAYEQRLRSTPTSSTSTSSSTSFNTSQSLQDPAAIALQQRQLEQQAAQASQEMQLAWAKLQQDILASNQRLGFESQNLQFLRDKLAIEQQQAATSDARATQALIEQITTRMERTATERAGMMQQAQTLQSQLQYQAQVENARNQMQADQLNEQRRQANLEQRRGVARDIAEFSRDPGDVGANAAYLTAGGAAPISQAMAAGKDARTQQSLLPLGLLLGTQDELNRGPAFLNAPQVNAPNVPLPQFGAITPPNASMLGLSPTQLPGSFLQAPKPLPVSQQQLAPPVAPAPAPTREQMIASGQYVPGGAEGGVDNPETPYDDVAVANQINAINEASYDASGQYVGDATAGIAEINALMGIPGYAQGTGGSRAPVSLVGERGPELLINQDAAKGGESDRFSVIPNDALPPQLGGQGSNPFLQFLQSWAQNGGGQASQGGPMNPQQGFLNTLPPQAAPQAVANRGSGTQQAPQGMRGLALPSQAAPQAQAQLANRQPAAPVAAPNRSYQPAPQLRAPDVESIPTPVPYTGETIQPITGDFRFPKPPMSLYNPDWDPNRVGEVPAYAEGTPDVQKQKGRMNRPEGRPLFPDPWLPQPGTMDNLRSVTPEEAAALSAAQVAYWEEIRRLRAGGQPAPEGFPGRFADELNTPQAIDEDQTIYEDDPRWDPQTMGNKQGMIPAYAQGTPDVAAPFDRSLGFLNSAFQQALGQSPWAQSGVPTPVGLSAPGTNPFLQEYAAALAATGSGIKPGLFQYEINQWKPQALSAQTVTRRTR